MTDPAISEIRATSAERPKLRAVRDMIQKTGAVRLRAGSEEVELPSLLVKSLLAITESLDEGATVAILSEEAEVSPAQAAQLLGVSRQYVDRLVAREVLSSHRLPYSSYRRIPVREVLAFKFARDRKREGIRAVVDEATGAGLEY